MRICLVDGRIIEAPPRSFSRSSIQFEGRTITIGQLPPPYQDAGYGEVIQIHLRSGNVQRAVLRPEEYRQHQAVLIDTTSEMEHIDETTSKIHWITAMYDSEAGMWKEKESEQE